jgi:hypothetical protein
MDRALANEARGCEIRCLFVRRVLRWTTVRFAAIDDHHACVASMPPLRLRGRDVVGGWMDGDPCQPRETAVSARSVEELTRQLTAAGWRRCAAPDRHWHTRRFQRAGLRAAS